MSVPCKPYKSIAAAITLSIFFGVFGVLYANFWAGVCATLLLIAGAEIPKVGNYVFFGIWILCPFVSVYLAERYNSKLNG